MRLVLNLLVISLVLGSLQSCVSKKKFDELTKQKEATDQALAETQGQLSTLQDEKSALEAEFASEKERMNGEISSIKSDLQSTQSQVAQVQEELNMTKEELDGLKAEINGIFAAYSDSGLSMEEKNGKLVVMTKVPVQYRSGSYSLTKDEKDALAELAETLKGNENLKILVEGHTDDDGVKGSAPYSDNWELGYLRAKMVVKELIKNGVSPSQVAAVTYGETMPAASNDDADGKAQNRRTEVVPNIDLTPLMKKGN